jgi:hypothetical protein
MNLGWVSSFKLRKSAEFHFKNLVQFGTSFRCYGLPGKSGGSRMNVDAQWSHVHHQEPLARVCGFKLWKAAQFWFKIWFNLELGSGALGHVGHLRCPKCVFMRSDHISATLGRSAQLQIATNSRILLQKLGSMWNWVWAPWVTWEVWCLRNACQCSVITYPPLWTLGKSAQL